MAQAYNYREKKKLFLIKNITVTYKYAFYYKSGWIFLKSIQFQKLQERTTSNTSPPPKNKRPKYGLSDAQTDELMGDEKEEVYNW